MRKKGAFASEKTSRCFPVSESTAKISVLKTCVLRTGMTEWASLVVIEYNTDAPVCAAAGNAMQHASARTICRVALPLNAALWFII
jgi:hypothetical protein